MPTPWPRVAESTLRIFTVGSSHLVSRSSPPWDWSSSLAFVSSMARMASGEAQPFISAASGWVVRSFLVFFSYSCRAFSKISWKGGVVDEEDARRVDDVVPIMNLRGDMGSGTKGEKSRDEARVQFAAKACQWTPPRALHEAPRMKILIYSIFHALTMWYRSQSKNRQLGRYLSAVGSYCNSVDDRWPSVEETSRPMVSWRSKLVGLWPHWPKSEI